MNARLPATGRKSLREENQISREKKIWKTKVGVRSREGGGREGERGRERERADPIICVTWFPISTAVSPPYLSI